MTLVTNEKQPYEEVDLTFDFSNRGVADGVTISAVGSITSTLVSGTGVLVIASATHSGLYTKARFSGGNSGDRFKVTARVTMTDGQKYECDGFIKVKEL